jgi:acyl carrier protein
MSSPELAVREFLKHDLGKDISQVGSDESLLESGTLDSVGVMRLVAFLERTFGIHVDDDDLMPENFDTLSAIVAFIDRRRTGAHG